MLRPFHYAFLVRDLDAARHFYGNVLGCTEGRWAPTWVDFDFFGSQLSMHLSRDLPETKSVAEVDGVEVPMPHFGAVIPWDAFDELASRLSAYNAEFLIPPEVRTRTRAGTRSSSRRFEMTPSFSGAAGPAVQCDRR